MANGPVLLVKQVLLHGINLYVMYGKELHMNLGTTCKLLLRMTLCVLSCECVMSSIVDVN